jgi:hypothetical protein
MITIRHTPADGTLVEGSRRGDGVWEILVELRGRGQGNWKWSRQVGLYLGQSRDKPAQQWKIDKAAEALRAAGFDVKVEVDNDDRRSFAEAEAERYERAEERADRFGEYAGSAAGRSHAAWQRSHQISERFAMGQPILVGHHSERGARRDQQRMDDAMRRSIAEDDKAGRWSGRAAAAAGYRARRESVPTTLRRIEKLEAEARLIRRRLEGTDPWHGSGRPAAGGYRKQLLSRAVRLAEELAYWREHVEQSGVKVWGPADFAKGDFVVWRFGTYQVERVNQKSLTVPKGVNDHRLTVVTRDKVTYAGGEPSKWTWTIPYDEVRGRKSAEEMAAFLAEVKRLEAH